MARCARAPNALAGTNTLAVLSGAELRITATQNVPLTVSLSTNAVLTLATADAFTGDIALTLDSAIVRPQMPAVLNLAGETLFTGTSVLDFGETPLAIGPALFDPDATVTLTGNLETDTLRFQQQLRPRNSVALSRPPDGAPGRPQTATSAIQRAASCSRYNEERN